MTTTKQEEPLMSVSRRRNNRRDSDALQSAISELGFLTDQTMVDLFNTICRGLGGSFTYPLTGKVSRLREIISAWNPLAHDSTLSPEFRASYVKSHFLKRYISEEEVLPASQNLQAKAAMKFLNTNYEGWSYDGYIFNHEELSSLMTKMRYIIGTVLSEFSLEEIYSNAKHGPNSTTTIKRDDAFIDIKNADWDGTAASLQQLYHYMCWDSTLHDAMVDANDEHRSLLNDLQEWQAYIDVNAKDYTKLSLVAKDWKSLRTMCPERTVPAFFGQGVGISLQKALLKVNIDLATQPDVHRNLARIASLFPDSNIGTLDWSEASDRIWILLCEAVMTEGCAPKWLDFIKNVCRCSSTQVDFTVHVGSNRDFPNQEALKAYLDRVSDSHTLRKVHKVKGSDPYVVMKCTAIVQTSMIGTMGNAITFPLQTLLFYSFLTACTELAQDRANANTTDAEMQEFAFVSCFGDDGIMDSRAYHVVRHFAPLIGWKLNEDKTFMTGIFRESCGGDYHNGKATRPLMMKRPPFDTRRSINWNRKLVQAWLYIAANQAAITLEQFSVSADILDKWLLRAHARFGLGKVCVVPPSYPDGSGYRIANIDASHYIDGVGPVIDVNCGLFDHNKWHIPWYSPHYGFVFRALVVKPRRRIPSNEFHYLWCKLKGINTELSGDHPGYHKSILDTGLLAKDMLDSDGTVALKECRLVKGTSSSLSWC